MNEKIEIFCESKEDVSLLLNHLISEDLECLSPKKEVLGFDFLSPEIIVIGSNILITLINAIFTFLKGKQGKTIIIKGKNNWQIEVPSSSSKKEIEAFIKMANSNEASRIVIVEK